MVCSRCGRRFVEGDEKKVEVLLGVGGPKEVFALCVGCDQDFRLEARRNQVYDMGEL